MNTTETTEAKMLTVLHLKAGELQPEVKVIQHTLENLQGLVGGWLDVVRAGGYLPEELTHTALAKYDIWVNDEGLVNQLPFNICLNRHELTAKRYEYAGILAGDIFLAGRDDEGNTTSIQLEDVPELKRVLQTLMLTNQERQEKLQRFMEVSDNV